MNTSQSYDLEDEKATVAFGRRIGKLLESGAIIFLDGQLGAGKTTATRGVLQAFGFTGPVKSPTYTLVEPYELEAQKIFHFDLYRLGDPEELEYMGIRDYFLDGNVCLVEWAERGEGYLPEPDLIIRLSVQGLGRQAQVFSGSARGESLLCHLKTQIEQT